MALGYYNFAPIESGNANIANQLAGLGQQIGHAIETHAATQSAQAMLPMIQQQYANGMQKVARGDQSGMSDVIQAAGLAGQNPLTQHLSNQFITGMQQVSEMARARELANARLQGSALNYAGRLYSSNASHPVDASGNPIARPETGGQSSQMLQKYRAGAMNLWNGGKDVTGAKDLLSDWVTGKNMDNAQLFQQKLNQYVALKKDRPGFSDPNFENALHAKDAIAQGADRNAVLKRLQSAGEPTSPSTAPSAPTAPAQQSAPSASPMATPSGMQINPNFNTGGMIPAATTAPSQPVVPSNVSQEQPEEEEQPV